MSETSNVARAAILDRIRAANRGVGTAMCGMEYEAIARTYQQTASMDRAAILKTFVERLHEYDAQVHEATSASLHAVIGKVFDAHGQRSGVVANGISHQWLPETVDWRMDAGTDTECLNTTEYAIAACEVAIAHTGTIVLKGSRKLTLLPDHLLCVVHERQVVETVPEAMARLQPFADSALTFISGPSATADIEMTRIRGVHGPRFLDVMLVRNPPSQPVSAPDQTGPSG